jgi:hypothetical protein
MTAVVPNCSFFSDAAAAALGKKGTPARTMHRDVQAGEDSMLDLDGSARQRARRMLAEALEEA